MVMEDQSFIIYLLMLYTWMFRFALNIKLENLYITKLHDSS